MKQKFTQGTIIEEIRSNKYPTIRCKGIVISARCDLANNKINQFHCLTALTLDDWIYEVLFKNIVSELKKDVLKQVVDLSKKYNLDYETVVNLGVDNAEKIFRMKSSKNDTKTIVSVISKWKKYKIFENGNLKRVEKHKVLAEEGRKKFISKFHYLHTGAFPKYCFVPRTAFSIKTEKTDGLVVDLQDIHQINCIFINDIINNRCDYELIKNDELKTELNKIFFFENKNDFVIADNIVKSPWIEHILQLFAHSFIRIGVDNACDNEIDSYCKNFFKYEY